MATKLPQRTYEIGYKTRQNPVEGEDGKKEVCSVVNRRETDVYLQKLQIYEDDNYRVEFMTIRTESWIDKNAVKIRITKDVDGKIVKFKKGEVVELDSSCDYIVKKTDDDCGKNSHGAWICVGHNTEVRIPTGSFKICK